MRHNLDWHSIITHAASVIKGGERLVLHMATDGEETDVSAFVFPVEAEPEDMMFSNLPRVPIIAGASRDVAMLAAEKYAATWLYGKIGEVESPPEAPPPESTSRPTYKPDPGTDRWQSFRMPRTPDTDDCVEPFIRPAEFGIPVTPATCDDGPPPPKKAAECSRCGKNPPAEGDPDGFCSPCALIADSHGP